jgi:hypothetical protein
VADQIGDEVEDAGFDRDDDAGAAELEARVI